jgi:hypothetical protein
MQRVRVLLAAAAFGTLVTLPQAGSASPLATGLERGGAVEAQAVSGPVQSVHYKRYRYGRYHRYRHGYRYYRRYPRYRHYYYYYNNYYDNYYYPYSYPYYSYYHPYRYRPYAYFPGPFIGLSFGF